MPQTNRHTSIWLIQILKDNKWSFVEQRIDSEDPFYRYLVIADEQAEDFDSCCMIAFSGKRYIKDTIGMSANVHTSEEQALGRLKRMQAGWPDLTLRLVRYDIQPEVTNAAD